MSANGTNNGIIWAIAHSNNIPAILTAYNPTNLTNEIYNSAQAAGNRDQMAVGVKFAVPTVANGKVYAAGRTSVTFFGLLGGNMAFSSATYTAQEAGGAAAITVNRTGSTQGAVQVSYATVAGGSATGGLDYTSAAGVLSWANGDGTPKTFNVPILNDTLAEPAETVNLVLSNPAGGYLGAQSTAVLTILEEAYDAWRFAHFGTSATNAVIAGDLADPDGDGVLNLLEYAQATDPISPGSAGSPTGRSWRINSMAIPSQHSGDRSHFCNPGGEHIGWIMDGFDDVYTHHWMGNEHPGATAAEGPVVGSPPDQYVPVTVTDAPGAAGWNSRFFRLAVHF